MVTLANFRLVLAWAALAGLTWCLFLILKPFFHPLAWAAVLAIFFHSAHKRVRAKLKGRNRSALVSTVLVTLILILPAVFVLQAVISQAISTVSGLPTSELFQKLRDFVDRLPEPLHRLVASIRLEQIAAEVSVWARANLAAESARLAGNLARFFFEMGVMLFALFYFFRDGHMLTGWLSDLNLVAEERRKRLMHDVANDVRVSVSSTIVVAAAQGFLGGLMFWALGLSEPLLWGVVMALVSLVPVLGPWLIYLPASAYLIANGHYGKGIAMAVMGLVVVSSADNLLRPFLIAGRSTLNALWVFLSVLGGLQTFGLLGVVAGPVLVGAAHGFLRALREDALLRHAQAVEAAEATAIPEGTPAPPAAPSPAPGAAPEPRESPQ